MIIYYAGVGRNTKSLYSAISAGGCRHIMLSYYYRDEFRTLQIRRFRRLGLHLFLDSGAFSAWTKGIRIDIDEYCQFIKDGQIGKYIVLDTVLDDRNAGAEQTYENLKYMESKGLMPVPVFHYGSDLKYLERLVNEGYEYICLGGTVGISSTNRAKFFDEVFGNYPDTFFHGLGMTDPKLIRKYPWFSVDSSTWLSGRKYNRLVTENGQIPLPEGTPQHEKIARNVEFFVGLEEGNLPRGYKSNSKRQPVLCK